MIKLKFIPIVMLLLVQLACGEAINLTPTLASLTDTLPPVPTNSPTGTPTPGEVITMNDMRIKFTVTVNANCRMGPGTSYKIVAVIPSGTSIELMGRNKDSTWWLIYWEKSSTTCWISDVTGNVFGNPTLLPMATSIELPPTPLAEKTKIREPKKPTNTVPPAISATAGRATP